MTANETGMPVVLENVAQLINNQFSPANALLVNRFVSQLYRGITFDDLQHRSDSDLYGAAISLYHKLCQPTSTQPYVRVYNPNLSDHGWQSPHTIVEIIVNDAPFLVDSVRMALSRLQVTAHFMLHQPLHVVRNQQGQLEQLLERDNVSDASAVETVFLIEIDNLAEPEWQQQLVDELTCVVQEVQLVVADWQPMVERLHQVIDELPAQAPSLESATDTLDFLHWIAQHNFTFLGYRRYHLQANGDEHELIADPDTSLGILRELPQSEPLQLSQLTATARQAALSKDWLVLTKSNYQSRIHRASYIDYIGVKRFDEQGNVVGEDRFMGLYTSSIYRTSVLDIPLIGAKIQRILQHSGLEPGAHAYKALQLILETYPRDELIQASEQELQAVGMGVLGMQERDLTRLFVRRDLFGRFFSCMVYVSKERYSTALRQQTQTFLQRYFGSTEAVEFSTHFTEGRLARTHYLIRVPNNTMDIDVNYLQENLTQAARRWEDKLTDALVASEGEAQGQRLANKYRRAFTPAYTDTILPSAAVADITKLEGLSEQRPFDMLFYQAQAEQDTNRVRLKLFHRHDPIHLSDVLPMLENMGLRVIGETPYQVNCGEQSYWVLDFSMSYNGAPLDLGHSKQRFQDTLTQVWNGELENDGFNRLVLASGLTGREVSVLRAYAKYMHQIGVSFSQHYIETTLARYPKLTVLLFQLFEQRFSLTKAQDDDAEQTAVHNQLVAELDQVANLDDDRIIRRYMEMIEATLRTNFYQTLADGELAPYIALKLAPETISEMPKPLPMFEVFVYSPRVEGVHLRWGNVARGGLRWSDRNEDFRTEVLGLVKAQQVKNTVIVPVGAKGGFVCKQLPEGDRKAFLAEGQACYQLFIRALLDVTDNIIDGKVVPATDVVRHDGDDYYLVVAADKGTATFSDIANDISDHYQHWLGDAFASGGSIGYDHKKMAITARGGWESVKRHFKEMGIDCQTTDFTAVGIGDMGGDVFGNGMLRSAHTCLVGAFNHLHIFIDPTPDASSSFKERERLFTTPNTSWDDYDRSLISKGGGVFERSAKSISLTPEMQTLLDTDQESLAPNEVIRHLLCAKVDLIWNGGIGTYIKSAQESDAEVGDRANDGVRVNGEAVRANIVTEGGNLGCTQLGRIEYARQGGRINADFIDNVGGVDCSDNEVNIKILLNALVADGELTEKHRNELLFAMTDEVADIVLTNAYRQSQTLSITERSAVSELKTHQQFIHELERTGKLDRKLEFLPNDEELGERLSNGCGLTRPELAILVAYAKMGLKDKLNIDELTNNDAIAQLLPASMPDTLVAEFGTALMAHPLRGEMIATRLANIIVNDMGFTFVYQLQSETGASISDIAVSFMIAREVFGMDQLLRSIEALDNQVPAQVQLTMFAKVRRVLGRATRWLLRSRDRSLTIAEATAQFKPAYDILREQLYSVMVATEAEEVKQAAARLTEQQVPNELAEQIAQLSHLFSAFDIAQIAKEQARELAVVAQLYFHLGAELELHWLLEQINQQSVANHWQALAKSAFREDLDYQQRSLSAVVLKSCKAEDECANMLTHWLDEHQPLLERWRHLLADFKAASSHEFAQFSVAMRELNLLHLNCSNAV